jgi:pimeloyl-ACP methyl ester carboxylesterase
LARSAPCAIAIHSPSPVLFGGEAEPCIRPRKKCLHQTRIPFETAGAQNDCAAGAHRHALPRQCDPHSSDFSAVGNEFFGPRIRQRRHSGAPPSAIPSSARAYERIGVPTLVVEGRGDKVLPAGWAAQIAERIEGGRSVVVDEAGHCPQIEQSSVVNGLLLDFFGTVSAQKM